MTGSSVSAGSCLRTRPTRSRTSHAAMSGFESGRKRTECGLLSGRLLRGDGLDAFDAGDRVLENLRHLGLDDFRARPGIGRAHLGHGLVDVRGFGYRETRRTKPTRQSMSRLRTVEKTGRRMKSAKKLIA